MREKSLFTVLLLENSSRTGTKSWENRTMQEETRKKRFERDGTILKNHENLIIKLCSSRWRFACTEEKKSDENYFPFSSDWRGRPSIVRGNLKYFFHFPRLSPLKQLSESNTEQVCDVDTDEQQIEDGHEFALLYVGSEWTTMKYFVTTLLNFSFSSFFFLESLFASKRTSKCFVLVWSLILPIEREKFQFVAALCVVCSTLKLF